MELTKGNLKKTFFSYLLPSIGATLATSIYVLADTIMIGQYEGELGLFALNVVLPVFSVMAGIGVLFGVGGGVLYSVAVGAGDAQKARRIFTLSLIMMAVFTAVACVAVNVWFTPIMRLLGATERIMPLVQRYGRIITLGTPLFAYALFIQAFIRNDKNPKLAMAGVIAGGLINVVLDYILVFPCNMGMSGAAIATVISYGITGVVCSAHFFKKSSGLRLSFRGAFRPNQFFKVTLSGLSSFIIEIAGGFTIFVFNRVILSRIGDYGVVVYGVISNVVIVGMSLFNGAAQAAQPITAANYGAGHKDRVRKVFVLGLITELIIGAVLFLSGEIFPQMYVYLFVDSPSASVLELSAVAMRLYFIAMLFMNVNIFISGYLQAVLKSTLSFTLSILRGLMLNSLFAVAFAALHPLGVWLAVPAAEILVCAAGAAIVATMAYREKKKDILKKTDTN